MNRKLTPFLEVWHKQRTLSSYFQPYTNHQLSPYLPLKPWIPSRGTGEVGQTNFSWFQPPSCLNLQWPSETFIHPNRVTMTDLSSTRSICISFSLVFFFSLCLIDPLPLPHSPSSSFHRLAVLLMCRIWWKSEAADGFLSPCCVRVTTQSLSDLGKQLIPTFIYLFLWHV